MPVSFRILAEHGLVYVRFSGAVRIADAAENFATFLADPDYRKGLKQLIDFTHVTEWDQDFNTLMKFNARQTDIYDDTRNALMMVCLAPDAFTQSLANFARRGWESSSRVVTCTAETEEEALALLGIDAPSLSILLQSV
ncbi:MAG: hypothetical protein KDK10_17990 [Maritimibacter sp.]|nr:hypothetical protein [Maritimibacter sp.]